MKFHVWKEDPKRRAGPAGPWEFLGTLEAPDKAAAIVFAKNRFGAGEYEVYTLHDVTPKEP